MSAIFSLFADFFVGMFKSIFTSNRDERMGILETTDAQKTETIHELEVDKAVSDKVDAMSDADRERLRTNLNNRPAS